MNKIGCLIAFLYSIKGTYSSVMALSSIICDPNAGVYNCTSYWLLKQGMQYTIQAMDRFEKLEVYIARIVASVIKSKSACTFKVQ